MSDSDVAVEVLRDWLRDPELMVRELWPGTVPDEWQKAALKAFPDPDPQKIRIALQACAGPGKSTVLNWIGWNFLLCYAIGQDHPNGLVVSITGDNLKANLWKEFAVWYGRSAILQKAFEITGERIRSREHPKTWWLEARSFAKSADADAQGRTLSGLHSKAILYLIDESGDMPLAVFRAAEQGLGNCEFGKIVTAFNPTSHSGAGYNCVNAQAHMWTVIRITADPDDPQRTPRVSADWARQQIALYGRDNPWVMAYILGKFPPSSLNAMLGPDDIRTAMDRHLTSDQYSFSQKRLGIDPARFGDDSTVIFPRQGLAAFKPVVMRGARTFEVAGRIIAAKTKWNSELELIDSTGGYGGGIADDCILAGVHLYEVNFSGLADDPRFFNKRSEIIWRTAEWVKHAGGALPNDPDLVREGAAPTYWLDKGKLRVTEKDQIKKELGGHSPDKWDALCVTFALAEAPTTQGLEGLEQMLITSGSGHAKTEYDPWA